MTWQPELASVHTRGQHIVRGSMSDDGVDIDYGHLKLTPSFQGKLFCIARWNHLQVIINLNVCRLQGGTAVAGALQYS